MSLFTETLAAVRGVNPALLDPKRVTAGDESPLMDDPAPMAVVTMGRELNEQREIPSDGEEGDGAAVVELWVPVVQDPDWYAATAVPLVDAVAAALRALVPLGYQRRVVRTPVQRAYLANVPIPAWRKVTFTLTEQVW